MMSAAWCKTIITVLILWCGGFYFVWFIVGNVWYFEIDSCDDFEIGYTLTLALLILGQIGVFCCFGLIVWWCYLVKAAEEKKNDSEEDRYSYDQVPRQEYSPLDSSDSLTSRTSSAEEHDEGPAYERQNLDDSYTSYSSDSSAIFRRPRVELGVCVQF